MIEVIGKIENVLIKKSNPYPNLWCLIHDKKKVIVLVAPGGKTWAGEDRVMLVGTEKELREEIKRLFESSIEPSASKESEIT